MVGGGGSSAVGALAAQVRDPWVRFPETVGSSLSSPLLQNNLSSSKPFCNNIIDFESGSIS